MSWGEKLLAGTGMGMASIIRAVTPGKWSAAFGLPATAAEAAKVNAPLAATTPGKIGDFAGKAALTAPAMLIPGANTYAGAGLIGAGLGAATTEGGLSDRAQGAAMGAAGGVSGKALGDGIAAGVGKLKDMITSSAISSQSANAARDAAVATARAKGYVLPPQEVNPGMINGALEGLSGKIKTSQAASQQNQSVTNNLAKTALGLPTDQPLTSDAIQSVRQQAGQAYQAVRNTGMVTPGPQYTQALDAISNQANGAAKSFPGLKNDDVASVIDTLRQPQFAAGDGVDAVGALRDMADQAYRGGSKAQGKAFKQAAGAVEDALDQHLQQQGNPDALQAFRDARQTIAKTYTVENALNPVTGNVDASKLASQLQKGKPLSGELADIATVGSAFPKATQALKQNYNPVSPLDYAAGAMGAASGYASHGYPGLLLGASSLARPAVRSMLLSQPVQAMNAELGSNYGTPIANMLPAIGSQPMRNLLQIGATNAAIQKAQQ